MSWAAKFAAKRQTSVESGNSPRSFNEQNADTNDRFAAFKNIQSRQPSYESQELPQYERQSSYERPQYERPQYPGTITKKPAPVKEQVNVDSEEQFPALGGAKVKVAAAAVPKNAGFASLAASWAQQDAKEKAERETAAAEKERQRRQLELENARMPDFARLRIQRSYNTNYDAGDDNYDGYYSDNEYDGGAAEPPADEWSEA